MTPRLRISWLMAAVAFVAVDFAAFRACFEPRTRFSELAIVGVLPMANILSLGLLPGISRRWGRPFRSGFVVFGAAALMAYLGWAAILPDSHYEAIAFVTVPAWRPFRAYPDLASQAAIYASAATVVAVPQVIFAWAGGRLSTMYRLVIVRREPRPGMPAEQSA